MCSIGEEDFGDEGGLHAMTPDESIAEEAPEGACKCGQKNAIYMLQCRQPECRDCFLKYARHKFRATLGSSKVLPRDAEVLLVFDGSDESLVLLDMLHNSQTENNFKRLHCSVRILYMDEYDLLCPIDSAAYSHHLKRVQNYLTHHSRFESVICTNNTTKIRIYNVKDDVAIFEQRLPFVGTIPILYGVQSIRTATSRQDYLKCQRNNAIAVAAKFLNIEHVLVGDISTKLAADFIAAITLGRGGSAALDVSLVDNRLGAGLKLIRPLKDLTQAEIVLYISAQQLQPFEKKITCAGNENAISLQNVTAKFVADLQKNYPATVPTIYRTGNKIAPNRHDLVERLTNLNTEETKPATCSFCNSEFEHTETLVAIEYSRLVSGSSNTLDKQLKIETKTFIPDSKIHSDKDKVWPKVECPSPSILCHACRNIQNDCDESKPC